MRAAIRTGCLGYTLQFTSNQPEPIKRNLKSNEILINIKAAAINPVDYKLPRAALGSVYGLDFSGTIDAIGTTSEAFQVGDAVFGRCKGSLAEKSITETDQICKKPSFLSFEEAAALPTAYLTGIQGLRDAGGIRFSTFSEEDLKEKNESNLIPKENMSVLVIGASGGCGIAALHLLKGVNEYKKNTVGRIVAICSTKNSDYVLENGATEVVDYTNKSELDSFLASNEGKFDCVYDCSTGSGGSADAYYETSQILLKPETGQYVALNGSPSTWIKGFAGLLPENQSLVMTKTSPADLATICTLLEKADVKPSIEVKPFTEDGVKNGFALIKSRRAKGKIVFTISSH